MADDLYRLGGPYEVSKALLLDIIEQRLSPDGKSEFIKGIPFTEPRARRRTLTLLNLETGKSCTATYGDGDYTFSQQSMSKPSAACYSMHLLGQDPRYAANPLHHFTQRLGNAFSGRPYNHVNLTGGIPTNYSDNIGALRVWQLIAELTPAHEDPFSRFFSWFCTLTNTPTPSSKGHMAWGEYGEDGANFGLLRHLGIQQDSAEWRRVYLSYCRACAIHVTTVEAATVFGVIANGGRRPGTQQMVIPQNVAQHVYEGMRQHGAYDESARYYEKAKLYCKTGVDGGIMGQLENHRSWVFCGHHAPLNRAGNSGEVLKWTVDLHDMRITWPLVDPSDGAPSGLPHRDSALEIDENLRKAMKPSTLTALQAAIDSHVGSKSDIGPDGQPMHIYEKKRGLYLKLNPKNKPLEEDQVKVAEGTDNRGVFKEYFFMPDNHYLHKVLVRPREIGTADNVVRQVKKSRIVRAFR